MRAVAAAAMAAAVALSSTACGSSNSKQKAAASSAVAAATAAAGSALSQASSAAASVLSNASSAAASAASAASSAAASMVDSATAAPTPAPTAAAPGERPANNTVRVVVGGNAPKVYTPQSCGRVPGVDGFGFAGQADGGGELVITATSATSGMITILGGEVKAGNGNFSDLVMNPDGSFYGSAKFIDIPVTFYGQCDGLKK